MATPVVSEPVPVKPEDDLNTEEIKTALKGIVDDIESSDKISHLELRSMYRKHELYWHGIQKVILSAVSNTWVTAQGFLKSNPDADIPESAIGNRVINVYRAHGESIIAALTTGLPSVRFFPDDADNSDDLNTAKAASKISELIQSRNGAQLKFIQALFLMYNQGLVAAYNYHDQDKKYGVIEKQVQTGTEAGTIPSGPLCPVCGANLEQQNPDGTYLCGQCGETIPPDQADTQDYPTEVPTFETQEEPKTCEVIELFGPLHVKVPPYVRTIKDAGYLILEIEQHYALVREVYPELMDKITTGSASSSEYDRNLRAGREFNSDNKDLVTIRKCWMRSWTLNMLPDGQAALRDQLKGRYPNGYCVTLINDLFADIDDDNMDDHWTLTESPLSTKIHADPLGAPLIPVQEIRTEIVDLIVETLEKGIPQTFADPDVLDFDAYSKAPVEVGMVYPAKARGGANLDSAFTQLKTANLSDETRYFLSQLEQDAQFVGGAFPSIFGGIIKGGSGTASEYEQSRNQALQRLSTAWKIINSWWAQVMEKAVKSYIANVQEDDKMVKTQGDSFINVWIKKEELKGKIGGAESETSEQFPSSWVQQRGMLLELIGMNNPMLDQAIYSPENAETVNRIIGIPGIKIPGAADQDKQLAEIADLLKAAPIPEPITDEFGQPVTDPTTGMPATKNTPSVPIDPDVDNDIVQSMVCKEWAVSAVGRATKISNPEGYANVIAHMIAHEEHQMMMNPPAPAPGNPAPGNEPQKEPVQ